MLELSDQSARLYMILGETNKALAELAQEQGGSLKPKTSSPKIKPVSLKRNTSLPKSKTN